MYLFHNIVVFIREHVEEMSEGERIVATVVLVGCVGAAVITFGVMILSS